MTQFWKTREFGICADCEQLTLVVTLEYNRGLCQPCTFHSTNLTPCRLCYTPSKTSTLLSNNGICARCKTGRCSTCFHELKRATLLQYGGMCPNCANQYHYGSGCWGGRNKLFYICPQTGVNYVYPGYSYNYNYNCHQPNFLQSHPTFHHVY